MRIKSLLLIGMAVCAVQGKVSDTSAAKSFFESLPVVVTGGAGFIGSHLVEKLVKLDARVTVLDDLSSGRLENLTSVKDSIQFVNGTVTDLETCLAVTRNASIVFHFAASVSVPESFRNPQQCYDTNVVGTLNMLEACRINGVKRLTFSSSAAVYGFTSDACLEDSPTCPESPYGASKLIGELLCKQYARDFGLQTVCLRYFNVYGDRQNPDGAYAAVVAKFRHQMCNNLPITIFGDGLQTRDFITVHEVVDANLTVAMLEQPMGGDIFNIATGKSITLLQLVDMLKSEFPQYKQPLVFAEARCGDIRHSRANCKRYRKISEYE